MRLTCGLGEKWIEAFIGVSRSVEIVSGLGK